MRVVLAGNPRAGRGRAGQTLADAAQSLRDAGHDCDILDDVASAHAAPMLARADAIIVAGGDGTVHRLLPHLRGRSVAVHHAPLGTENLFAREFRMRADARRIAQAADAAIVDTIDLATLRLGAHELPFAIMCSIGPDAGVIRRLDAVRTGPISHASYILPVLREGLRPSLPRLTIDADGRTLCTNARGLLVVANLRQYALRTDPAYDADPRDGLLDVVFMPCAGTLGALRRLLGARLRRHASDVVRTRAAHVRVRSDDDAPVQVDGECVRIAGQPLDLTLTVDPRALRVLLPAHGAAGRGPAPVAGAPAAGLRTTV